MIDNDVIVLYALSLSYALHIASLHFDSSIQFFYKRHVQNIPSYIYTSIFNYKCLNIHGRQIIRKL